MPLSTLLMEVNVDYNAIAHVYDHRYEREEYPGLEEALATFIGDDPTGILEVGCGTGHWLAWLAQRGFSALAGLDPSAGMLAVAATKVRGADLRQGRAEHMPWHDASFDRVVCVNALQHFGDQPRFVAEARRVLQPGGGLITFGLDPHAGTDRWTVYDFFDGTLETDMRRYPPTGRIRGWLSAAGFAGARTFVAMHRPVQMPARAALAAGYLDRAATSQLTLLSDDVYEDGIARIRRRADQAERRGETFAVLSDLRLYATVAWVQT
jgi:ubiquinone/menaquinone biosynthesis C-methylase UbiE